MNYYISLYKDNAGPIFVGSWRKESNVFRLHSYDNTDILLKIKNNKSKILNIPTLSSYGWRNQSEKNSYFKFAPNLIPHWQDNAILYILLTCLIHLFEYSSAHAYFCLYISGSFFFKSTAIASKKMCSITLYLHDELVYYWESLS